MTDDREPIEKVRDELKALSSVEIYSPSSYTMELEGKVRALTARLASAEAERDKLRKRSTERRVQVTDLYGNLSLENDRLCTKLAAAEALLREAAIQYELGVDLWGMRQVRLPKEWYAKTLKTGVRPASAAKEGRDE